MRYKLLSLMLPVFILFSLTVCGEGIAGIDEVKVGKQITPVVTPLEAQVQRIDLGDGEEYASPRAYCDGEWQGPLAAVLPNWLYGAESYASYQDPTETGCAGTYPFEVSTVVWQVYAQGSATITFQIQPKVWAYTTPDVIGAEMCGGPLYSVNLPGAGAYSISLPFSSSCCVYGPYYAGVYIATALGSGVLDLILDDGVVVAPRSDANYNNSGTLWYDLVDDVGWPWNLRLWSEGENSIGNSCGLSLLCGDMDFSVGLDISDLTYIVDYLFGGGPPPVPMECAGDFDNDHSINISDLTAYVDYLFLGGPPPGPNCCNPPW